MRWTSRRARKGLSRSTTRPERIGQRTTNKTSRITFLFRHSNHASIIKNTQGTNHNVKVTSVSNFNHTFQSHILRTILSSNSSFRLSQSSTGTLLIGFSDILMWLAPELLQNRRAIAAKSPRNRCEIAAQSLCNQIAAKVHRFSRGCLILLSACPLSHIRLLNKTRKQKRKKELILKVGTMCEFHHNRKQQLNQHFKEAYLLSKQNDFG
jgi:hypothetical protein